MGMGFPAGHPKNTQIKEWIQACIQLGNDTEKMNNYFNLIIKILNYTAHQSYIQVCIIVYLLLSRV